MRMTASLILTIVLLASVGWAKKDLDKKDYPLTAHVKSSVTTHHRGGGTTSSYDYQTGKWSHGTVNSSTSHTDTEIQVGNLIYVTERSCKGVQAGMDFPAQIEKNKIKLLVSDKMCEMRIAGTQEAK